MAQAVQRTESQVWQAALDRALTEALDILVEPISGEAFCESSNHPGVLYHVGASFCSCPAGARGIPCKHRAAYLATIGELPLPTVVPVACPSCTRGKVEEWGVSGPIGCKPCDSCGGSGVKPDHRLHDAPPVQPVAA